MIQQLPAQERIIQADLEKKAPKKENKAFIIDLSLLFTLFVLAKVGAVFLGEKTARHPQP